MSEDAFDLKTAVVSRNSTGVVTRLSRRSAIYSLPVEILAEIFVQCIPPLVPSEPYKLPDVRLKTHPQQIRAIIALVCRSWRKILYDAPRAWGTLVLDYPNPNIQNVTSWLERSRLCPLDVFIDEWYHRDPDEAEAILGLFHNALPRIRSLFTTDSFMDSFSTFPTICSGLTILPRMESLSLLNFEETREWDAHFSFPRLRTLVVREFNVLIDGSLPNVHHLDIAECTSTGRSTEDEDGIMYIDKPSWSYQLLQIVPNLVSLTWNIQISSERLEPPVELRRLKFLTLPSYGRHKTDALNALECFVAPSLENLDIDLGVVTSPPGHEVMLQQALDVICRNGVRLRHLTLRCSPYPVNVHAMSPHLNHLDTCTIHDTQGRLPFDGQSGIDSDSDTF